MRFLLVLLAILSGLVMPQMAGATCVPVAGMGTALHEEQIASPAQEACLAPRAAPPRSGSLSYRTSAPLSVAAAASESSIALTDRPLE
jgi:hypothetical protein